MVNLFTGRIRLGRSFLLPLTIRNLPSLRTLDPHCNSPHYDPGHAQEPNLKPKPAIRYFSNPPAVNWHLYEQC